MYFAKLPMPGKWRGVMDIQMYHENTYLCIMDKTSAFVTAERISVRIHATTELGFENSSQWFTQSLSLLFMHRCAFILNIMAVSGNRNLENHPKLQSKGRFCWASTLTLNLQIPCMKQSYIGCVSDKLFFFFLIILFFSGKLICQVEEPVCFFISKK